MSAGANNVQRLRAGAVRYFRFEPLYGILLVPIFSKEEKPFDVQENDNNVQENDRNLAEVLPLRSLSSPAPTLTPLSGSALTLH